jgi:hypothetical protein
MGPVVEVVAGVGERSVGEVQQALGLFDGRLTYRDIDHGSA